MLQENILISLLSSNFSQRRRPGVIIDLWVFPMPVNESSKIPFNSLDHIKICLKRRDFFPAHSTFVLQIEAILYLRCHSHREFCRTFSNRRNRFKVNIKNHQTSLLEFRRFPISQPKKKNQGDMHKCCG